eukprot:PhF_6_TR20680/c0_g1_i1/m.29756
MSLRRTLPIHFYPILDQKLHRHAQTTFCDGVHRAPPSRNDTPFINKQNPIRKTIEWAMTPASRLLTYISYASAITTTAFLFTTIDEVDKTYLENVEIHKQWTKAVIVHECTPVQEQVPTELSKMRAEIQALTEAYEKKTDHLLSLRIKINENKKAIETLELKSQRNVNVLHRLHVIQ